MCKKIIFVFFLSLLLVKAADPQMLLENVVAMVGSPPERTWNNPEIGKKLREIRQNYSQTPQALEATALLAFYLSDVPGDHSKEIVELCDEVKAKSPHSWLAWLANLSLVASYGNREGGHQKMLDAAQDALANTNGEELSRDSNAMLIFKPLMDRWPPKANDFTDAINSVIVQEALALGQYKLGEMHLSKIVDPRIKASGEGYMADYLREHPEEQNEPIREQKHATGSVNDNNSGAIQKREIDAQPTRQVTPPESTTVALFWPWIAGTCLLMLAAWVMFKRRE